MTQRLDHGAGVHARYDAVTNDDLGSLDTDGVYDLIFAVQPTGS